MHATLGFEAVIFQTCVQLAKMLRASFKSYMQFSNVACNILSQFSNVACSFSNIACNATFKSQFSKAERNFSKVACNIQKLRASFKVTCNFRKLYTTFQKLLSKVARMLDAIFESCFFGERRFLLKVN